MKVKIGVISDTHNILREEVRGVLKDCDSIIHAGDFCNQSTLEELKKLAPFYGVKGNNDIGRWADELPHTLSIREGGMNFFIVHDIKELPKDLKGYDYVISGHSHQYKLYEDNHIWYLNPGGCGRARFRLELSMVVLEIENGVCVRRKIDISR